jgi:hypothetical protein
LIDVFSITFVISNHVIAGGVGQEEWYRARDESTRRRR